MITRWYVCGESCNVISDATALKWVVCFDDAEPMGLYGCGPDYVTLHAYAGQPVSLLPADEIMNNMSLDCPGSDCFRADSTSSKHTTAFQGYGVTDDVDWLTNHHPESLYSNFIIALRTSKN